MARKKSFTGEDSPARQFFSGAVAEPEPDAEQEPRTESRQAAMGVSMNEFFNRAVAKAVGKE